VRSCATAAVVAIALLSGALAQPLADGELVNALRQGGYVLVMRHANSPRTPPDRATADPGNTTLERQLSETGHRTASTMGGALKTLGIPIGDVLSSPTFRTLETVRDAGFGTAKTFGELAEGGQAMKSSSGEDAVRFLRARSAEIPRANTNTIIVTHLPNIQSAFGDEAEDFDEGEVLVLRPDGRTGRPVARVKIGEWPRLATRH
jgi:phosphohistidine phosphatase SixA